MTTARQHHTATLLQDGKVLITGAWWPSSAELRAELYDPSTGLFTATGSMPPLSWAGAATLLENGTVSVAVLDEHGLRSAELYNPGTGNFEVGGSGTAGYEPATSTLLTNGKVLTLCITTVIPALWQTCTIPRWEHSRTPEI